MVPLGNVAAQLRERLELLPALHALGDHLQVQDTRQGDHGLQELLAVGVPAQTPDHRPVQFYGAEGQAAEALNVRVPCSEVIKVPAQPRRSHSSDPSLDLWGLCCGRSLRELQVQG